MRPPAARASQVLRPRLQAHILKGLLGPLTLVIAPAGFGKTTLVGSCLSGCGIPVAWLSLDKDDNQPGHFLKYLVTSLHEAEVQIGNEAVKLVASSLQIPQRAVLTALINDLDAAACEVVLVLDDYQFISSQAVHDQVAFLLEHCPHSLHLLIASRSDPPLPLARLRARGQALELRASDLSFSAAETAQFLNEVMGLHLDERSVSVLHQRTEGWIAGLQMAALSMRHRQDVPGFIEAFSGTNRYILDYLLEEVLAGQPPGIQHFLLRTSILERLTAPLCDTLLQGDGAAPGNDPDVAGVSGSAPASGSDSILEYVERANLFLVPLDDERIWYRYHHLFADLLRTQLLKSIGSGALAGLHLRAAAWYEQNGSLLDAIHHASLASDDERVERLVEQNYEELINRGEMTALRYWTGSLARELVYGRPKLCLYEAYSHCWFGELDQAEELVGAAETCIQRMEPGPDAESLRGHLAYVRSRITALRGDLPRAIELNLAARNHLPSESLALKMDTGITLGFLYFVHGDFAHASLLLEQTIQSGRAVGAILNPVAAYCVLARLHAYRGLLHQSYDLYLEAARWIGEVGGRHMGASSLVDVGMADVLCEWNELDRALVHVERGLASIHLWGKPDDTILAHLTLARIQHARGHRGAAIQAVEAAKQVVATSGIFPEATQAAELAQLRLWLAQGDLPAANRWAASLEGRPGQGDPLRFENEVIHLARARLMLAQGRPGEALHTLVRLEEAALSSGRTGRAIEILMLQALALHKQGDCSRSLAALERCLNMAESEGYMRLFLDEGQPMRMLFAQWLAGSRIGAVRDYATRLLRAFDSELMEVVPLEETHAGAPLLEALSPRELEVLQLMALGCTNSEIAGQLIVAPGTVKAHTASIYRKLEAANRTAAVARARRLGILS